MSKHWDVIVLGVGGFGSAAFAHAAHSGAKTLGIEQFDLGHAQGSSHGETRIIRKAYFEHPDYVPLLERAYQNWTTLEQNTQTRLLERVGLFLAGLGDSLVVKGTRHAAQLHGLTLENLSVHEARIRFPHFAFRETDEILFEQDAGFLHVEKSVLAHAEWGRQCGGTLMDSRHVREWKAVGSGVELRTDNEVFHAGKLIVTAGPWTGRVLQDLGIPLVIKRKVLFWFDNPREKYRLSDGGTTFFYDRPEGEFYGFPSLDGKTLKLAEHTGGKTVDDPAMVDRNEQSDDLKFVAPFVRESLPALGGRSRHSVCLYTCTPDGHFIVDRHPLWPQVVLGAGFSGHGFKFTAGLGEALAELALHGRTDQPLGFLSLKAGIERMNSCR